MMMIRQGFTQMVVFLYISWFSPAIFYRYRGGGGVLANKPFDYYLLEDIVNATEGERLCRELGYNGLATPNTPEAYEYALKITAAPRSIGRGIDIGLRYFGPTRTHLWDNGESATSDLPWRRSQPTTRTYGRIYWEGYLMMHLGHTKKQSLCGRETMGQVQGTTRRGHEPFSSEPPLFQSLQKSYLSCVHRCGGDQRCRAAAFNFNLSTCTVFGPEVYTNHTVLTKKNPAVQTFIRKAFPPAQ